MPYNKDEPYNELPLLPPKFEIENLKVLRKLANTRAALAELKGRSVIIPNPLMLINTIVLQEAKASSEIENIVTTTDSLFKAFSLSDKANIDDSTKEVLRYREALWEGYQHIEKNLDETFLTRISRKIKQNSEGLRDIRWADTTRIVNGRTGATIYTPPEGIDIIRSKLKNFSDFISQSDDALDPLIKLAISHYQFEAIHPFSDGNGRTGRIINSLFLVKYNLLDLPILYLSKYIIEHKTEYYDGLRYVTEKDQWINWILFMLNAIEETSKNTLLKINSIKKLLDKTTEEIRKKCSPVVHSKELIEILFHQPYCKIEVLISNKIASSRNTASKYLNILADKGFLTKKIIGREHLYLNDKLYKLLSN